MREKYFVINKWFSNLAVATLIKYHFENLYYKLSKDKVGLYPSGYIKMVNVAVLHAQPLLYNSTTKNSNG